MDRRELLKMIALLTGTAVVGGETFLAGCTSAGNTNRILGLQPVKYYTVG